MLEKQHAYPSKLANAPSRKLIVTPGEVLMPRHVIALQSLLMKPSSEVNQVILDLKNCTDLSDESARRLWQLFKACQNRYIQFTVVRCSSGLLKVLVQESIEFLDILSSENGIPA